MKHLNDMEENFSELDARLKKVDNSTSYPQADLQLDYTSSKAASPRNRATRFIVPAIGLVAAGAMAFSVALPRTSSPLFSLSAGEAKRAGMSVASDMMMCTMNGCGVQYEYQAGASLSDQTGTGSVYKLVSPGESQVTAILASLAKFFSVSGSITKTGDGTAENSYQYSIGSTDGSSSFIGLGGYGSLSWNFYNPDAYMPGGKDGGPYVDKSIWPTTTQVRAKAAELAKQLGYASQEVIISESRDEFGVMAKITLKIDGHPTPVETYLSWSGTGVLASAGGSLGNLVKQGDFATISETAAVKRIADYRYNGYAIIESTPSNTTCDYGVLNTDGGSTIGSPVNAEPSSTASPASSASPAPETSSAPADQATAMPEPTPITKLVTISRAESALVQLYSADGSIWIVPGFILYSDDPCEYPRTVFSLVDGIIELPTMSPMVLRY